MSAWFNLKMLGSAALALGISTVSLWPEMASANIVFDFNGTCNLSGCPTTSDMATGVLTLTDAYVYGQTITSTTFVSFSYSSPDLSYDITSGDSPIVNRVSDGGINADGSITTLLTIGASFAFAQFTTGLWATAGSNLPDGNSGSSRFTPPSAVPEPSTWAMMLIGFAGLSYAGHRVSHKRAALAA